MKDPRLGVQEFAQSLDSLIILLKPRIRNVAKVEDAWRDASALWFNEGFRNYRAAYEEATSQIMKSSNIPTYEPREIYDYMVSAMSHASFMGEQKDFKSMEFVHALKAVAESLQLIQDKEPEIDSYFKG